MPNGYAMRCHAFADDCALCGLRRDDCADADQRLPARDALRKQRYGHIRLNVVDADVARGRAALFKPVPYILRVAFGDVEGYGDGCAAMHGSGWRLRLAQ